MKNVCVTWIEFNGAGVTLIVDLELELKWSCESSFNDIFLLIADNEGDREKDVQEESVMLQKRKNFF